MAKKGAMRRDPKYTTQPVKDGNGQTAGDSDVLGDTKGARRAAERVARRAPVERLSPGVYRSASGDLVGQGGRPIQRQPQAPMAQQVAGSMQPQPQQVGQPVADQTNKPFDIGQYSPEAMQTADLARQLAIQQGIQPNQMQSGYLAAPGIGKTPPGWSGGPVSDMMLRQPMPQGMPQMPQPSANQGGQYRLSPGMYGSREQAMQQYDQQMRNAVQPYLMSGVSQQRRG